MSNFVNNDVASGAIVYASDHNTQGALLAAVINGGLDNANIATNAAIDGSKLADGGITPAKLTSGTGASWAWQTWVPTLTNLSGGSQTFAKYIQIGKTVFFRFEYALAGANISGSVSFTLPVTAAHSGRFMLSEATLVDTGTAAFEGFITMTNTTTVAIQVRNVSGTYATGSNLSSTVPHTWANTDIISVMGMYEAA